MSDIDLTSEELHTIAHALATDVEDSDDMDCLDAIGAVVESIVASRLQALTSEQDAATARNRVSEMERHSGRLVTRAEKAEAEVERLKSLRQSAIAELHRDWAQDKAVYAAERDAYRDQSDEHEKLRGELVLELDSLHEDMHDSVQKCHQQIARAQAAEAERDALQAELDELERPSRQVPDRDGLIATLAEHQPFVPPLTIKCDRCRIHGWESDEDDIAHLAAVVIEYIQRQETP